MPARGNVMRNMGPSGAHRDRLGLTGLPRRRKMRAAEFVSATTRGRIVDNVKWIPLRHVARRQSRVAGTDRTGTVAAGWKQHAVAVVLVVLFAILVAGFVWLAVAGPGPLAGR